MSKSLEALEELKDEIIPDYALEYDDEGYKDWVIELYQTIKQDLECKEQLEIADRNNQNLVKTNVDLVNKNLELQKENQELKSKLSAIEFWNERYIEHNDKLKKAIEILKDKMRITVNIPYVWFEDKDNCLYFKVNQQEYDLLKEVLEC